MQDDYYETHFVKTPRRVFDAINRWKPAPAAIVDFGCGMGVKTVATAMAYPDALVTGVDVTNAFEKVTQFIGKYLDGKRPPNLRYVQIAPGQSLAEVAQPDVICSWSVLEHVSRGILPGVVADMKRSIQPGGMVTTQIAPLYYSPFGSHLRQFDPTPWNHLLLSHDEFRAHVVKEGKVGVGALGSANWMFARYEELNQITAKELFGYFRDAGFKERVAETAKVRFPIPEPLRHAFDEDALRIYELFCVYTS